jgi:hypothetical protein
MRQSFDTMYPLLVGGDTRAMYEVGLLGLGLLLGMSLVGSLFIAYLYEHFLARRSTGSRIHRAFPLIGISVTAIFICLEFSLPLSLGLLGALTLVRFRTPIKEPEEIGFIMLVVANAIACATYHLAYMGVLLMAAVGAAWIVMWQRLRGGTLDGVMTIRVAAGSEGEQRAIEALLQRHLAGDHLRSVTRDATDLVLAYGFRGVMPPALRDLRSEIAAAGEDAHVDVVLGRRTVS